MTQINNGGSAFPTAKVSINGDTATDGVELYGPGMSLRDWFAGQALVGMGTWSPEQMQVMQNKAHWAYAMADAMLAAREGSASV